MTYEEALQAVKAPRNHLLFVHGGGREFCRADLIIFLVRQEHLPKSLFEKGITNVTHTIHQESSQI